MHAELQNWASPLIEHEWGDSHRDSFPKSRANIAVHNHAAKPRVALPALPRPPNDSSLSASRRSMIYAFSSRNLRVAICGLSNSIQRGLLAINQAEPCHAGLHASQVARWKVCIRYELAFQSPSYGMLLTYCVSIIL